VKIDGEAITDREYKVPLDGNVIIKIGKRNYYRLGKK